MVEEVAAGREILRIGKVALLCVVDFFQSQELVYDGPGTEKILLIKILIAYFSKSDF